MWETEQSVKYCAEDGKWFAKSGLEWTDYTPCVDKQVLKALVMFFLLLCICTFCSLQLWNKYMYICISYNLSKRLQVCLIIVLVPWPCRLMPCFACIDRSVCLSVCRICQKRYGRISMKIFDRCEAWPKDRSIRFSRQSADPEFVDSDLWSADRHQMQISSSRILCQLLQW